MKTNPNQKSEKCDIQNIIQHYSHALYTKNLDLIHQTQKKISSDLLYYLKCMNLIFHQHNNNLSQNMEQSMRALRMFIKPSIQQKQCHIFPIFAYLAQRWDSAHLNPLLQSSNQDNSCIQAHNESSDYYNSLPFTAMSAEQIQFLKSGKANSFFSDLTKNELVLQSTQCVCCAQVFIRDFFIQNANPFIPMLVELSPKKALDNKVLERYLNAICNSGGGVIIIGAKKDGRKLKTIGIRFQNQQQVRSKQSQILSTISKLEWKHRYLLQKVLVHTPFTTQNSSQISKEYMCLCFRILIFPEQVQKLKYVSCIRKGQNPSYEFYQFENGEEDKKGQVGIICKQILYNKMHEIYAFSKHNIAHNNHKNVFCSRPHPYYSKLFYKYYNEGKLNLSVSTDELESEENDSPLQQKQQQTSSFPYRSLLIVGSYSHDKNITKFLQFIEENNQPCQIYRPYRNQFPQCVRSVWVLEHNMNHNKLKFLLKNFTERCLKTELITTMPVQIILEIQSTKFTSYIEKNLIKKLQKYFVQYIKKQGKKKQKSNKLGNGNKNQPQQEFAWYTKKKLMSLDSKHQESTSKLYLKFMNLQISLYSYMTFEELNLRPYFIPQDECKYSF